MNRVRVRSLVRVFAWTGLTSLGGGRSAYFFDAVVSRRPWVTTAEFVQDLTLAQLLPGPNFSNLSVALGCRLAGWPGGAWALAAVVGPGAVILTALAVVYFRVGFTPRTAHLMHGMAAAVVGLIVVMTARLVRASIRTVPAAAIAALVFVLVGVLRVNTVVAIALVVPASLWLHRPR